MPAPHPTSSAADLLVLGVLLGQGFTVRELARCAGTDVAAVWAQLQGPLRSGAVVAADDGFVVADPAARRRARALPGRVRRARHRSAAVALAALGSAAPRVAEQVALGAEPGDHDAVARLEGLAREVVDADPAAAVRVLELAERRDDRPAGDRVGAVLLRAQALLACARPAAAASLCREALVAGTGTPDEGPLRLCLVDALMRRGDLEGVHAETAACAAVPGLDPQDRVRVLTWSLFAPLWARDTDRLEASADLVLRAARASGDVAAQVQAVVAQCFVLRLRGRATAAERHHRAATELAARTGTQDVHRAVPHLSHAQLLTSVDRVEEARRVLATGRRAYTQLGVEPALVTAHHYGAGVELADGRWDEALAEVERAGVDEALLGQGFPVDALVLRALVQVRRGRTEDARRTLGRAREHAAAGAPEWNLGASSWVGALLTEADGDARAARDTLLAAWRGTVRAPSRCSARDLVPDLLRLCTSHPTPVVVWDELVDQTGRDAAADPDVVSVTALHHAARAARSADAGGLAAAALAARVLPPGVLPVALDELAARALLAAGRGSDAAAHAAAAAGCADLLGAVVDASRVRAAVPVPRPSGEGALSVSERRVVALVAEGLTNREVAARLVLSPHTVAGHVSRSLAKLGVRSRGELVHAWRSGADRST